MKKSKIWNLLMILVVALPLMVSCSKDDDGSTGGSSGTNTNGNTNPNPPVADIHVVVNEDGTTSNGSLFSAIDDKNFYVDYIKYTVKDGHLIVSGYDPVGFKGVANIIARITYKGNTYEVLGIGYSSDYIYPFKDCQKITSVIIPNSVTYMGKGCFFSCENITDIVIPNSVIEIGDYVFSGCTKLSSLKLSTGLTYIPAGAFEHCKSLLSVEIPNNIQSFYTYIDRGAFSDCSNLKKLTLGGGVSYIERKTFSECKQLEEVICLSVTPPKADIDVFYDSMIDYTTLYVPDGSVESYKVEVPWKNFKEILPLSSSGIKTIMVGDEIKDIYAPDGSRLSEIRKGINIVRTKNGNTKKVLIK